MNTLGIFSKLPPEIRHIIWQFSTSRIALGNDLIWPDPRSTHGGAVRDRRHALALLRTSKAIYSEVVQVVYAGKHFLLTIDAPSAAFSDSFCAYLHQDSDAGPERMPGPSSPSSTTSWWHLLGSIGVGIHPPLERIPEDWAYVSPKTPTRAWELLALRAKIKRLICSWRASERCEGGLPALDIGLLDLPAQGSTCFWRQRVVMTEKPWIEHVLMPTRTMCDSPWSDVELLLAEFLGVRGVKKAEIDLPKAGIGDRMVFCFGDADSLAETMEKRIETRGDDDSYGNVIIAMIDAYCQDWIETDAEGREAGMITDHFGTYRLVTDTT